ncbi:ribonuclease H-like domain-containing protein [Tanacetum coccineum]
MVAASKVFVLKPGEFEIWRMRIEQYIQMIDYALWEVIKNGNTTPKTTIVEGVEKLKFNSIKDAKLLLEAIEKRFGGNAATKKTQRNLLKQQYENLTAPSSETLNQTFDRLQKLVSMLEILETIEAWKDLYNNLKVYEPEVKGTSSSNTSTQNMAFVSSNNFGNTNEAVNTAHGVSAVSTQVNAANSTNVDNLSDAVICAFFSNQPNNSQLANEDLKQAINTARPKAVVNVGNLQMDLQDQGVIGSGCSRHMTGNMSYLTDYEDIYEGYVPFGANPKGGKIMAKGKAAQSLLCLVTILNTIDHLGKFDGKADEGTKASDNAGQAKKETKPVKDYILLPLWITDLPFSQDPKSSQDDGSKLSSDNRKKVNEDPRKDSECNDQEKENNVNNTNNVNDASINEVNVVGAKTSIELPDDPNMSVLEDISIFDLSRDDEDVGAEADMNNLDTTIQCIVGDIIFGSTKKELCIAFEKLMHEKFQDGVYGDELTVLFGITSPSEKMSMIGSLMYLTSSRPDIIVCLVCAYARYQVNPKVSHLHAVKRIFSARNKQWLQIPQQKLSMWLLQVVVDKDCNEKKLIQMLKIHTDKNVVDLLTKAFDNGIGVNVGDSKLMLLGINLLLLGKVNTARHKLIAAAMQRTKRLQLKFTRSLGLWMSFYKKKIERKEMEKDGYLEPREKDGKGGKGGKDGMGERRRKRPRKERGKGGGKIKGVKFIADGKLREWRYWWKGIGRLGKEEWNKSERTEGWKVWKKVGGKSEHGRKDKRWIREFENNKLRAQLKGKFSESQMNHNGTSVNTKLSKPSTSGTKICSVTLFPKSKVIPKVFEKNNLSKLVTSHLTTNKIIEKCTKVLDSGLLKIESKPIIAYFKNNRDVHHDFLKVTKEHVATPQELLEEARVLKPLDEHIGHASKFVERIQEQLVYLSAASRVSSINASGSKPKSNTKNDRIPQSSSRSMKNKVEAYHRKFKSSANKNNHVLDCLKWILTGRTFNLVGKSCPHSSSNDTSAIVFPPVHILTTTVIPVNVPFPKQRLGHNLFFVGHFCDLDLKVAFRKHTCFVRKLEGVDLLSGSCGSNLYTISMADMMKYSPICLHSEALKMKSWLWHRRLSHLKFGTINKLAKQDLVKGSPKLKYTKDLLFSVCQMGKSKKESHPHKPEPNDFEDVGKLQPKADIGIFISYSPSKKMAYEQHGLGPDLQGLTSGHISLGLVLNQNPSVASTPIFVVTLPTPDTARASSSSFTSIDKDAPSPSISLNNETLSLPINSTNVEQNKEVVVFDSDTFTNPFAPPNTSSVESSSRIRDTSNMHTFQQPPIYTK